MQPPRAEQPCMPMAGESSMHCYEITHDTTYRYASPVLLS